MKKSKSPLSILIYCILMVSVIALVVSCEDDVVKVNDAELTIDLSELYASYPDSSPIGANVILKKESGTQVDTKTATSNSVVFSGINYGTYMIEITHTDHPICINEDISVLANNVTHTAHYEANVTFNLTALFPDNVYQGVRVNYQGINVDWSGSNGVGDTGIEVAKKVRYGTYNVEVEHFVEVDGITWDETIYDNQNLIVNTHTVTYACTPQFAEVTIDLHQLPNSPAGASVTLRRSSGGTGQTETATGNTVIFSNVAYGLYHIEVTHDGHHYVEERVAVKESHFLHTFEP